VSAIYPKTLEAMWGTGAGAAAGTVKIQAVDSTYVYNVAHDFFNDVGGGSRLGTAATLASKTFTDGVFDAADLTITGVDSGDTVAGYVIYVDSGVESTSRLLVFEDRYADTTPVDTDGQTGIALAVSWPLGAIASI
jgi:hypothetical protein